MINFDNVTEENREKHALREKYPNTELFLVRNFLYLI